MSTAVLWPINWQFICDVVEHGIKLAERQDEGLMNYLVLFADDGDWAPPTDAELKVLAARRERQEKVSKLLGEYLLKGYKMLGMTCPTCEVSLLLKAIGNILPVWL
jgi:hypothetical protein